MSAPTPPAGTPTPRTPGGSRRWEPPTPAELQALLPDDYTVEKLLGRGGMGAVYQGRRLSLDRAVAIKILSNDLDEADASYAKRFKNEAQAMARLSHPGIVAVYGFGETADGLLYIVMEFIEGTDVHRMIKEQGRLRTEHAMAIAAHVCDALAFAHENGIIHRDIKPANIMVGYDGVVKVADFGLAKMTVDGATLGLTRSGMAMGTLHYMAPEALILGTAVDHRADIYAVGVMLYQMLTGKLPQGVVDPPSEQVPGLDPRYDAIIAKAMNEDREERYQSVRELRSDLDKTLTKPVVKVAAEAAQAPAALTTTARPQRAAKPRFSWRLGFRLGVCILVLGGASYLWFRPQSVTSLAKPEALVTKAAPDSVPDTAAGPAQAKPSKPPQTSGIQATKEQPFVNSLGMKFVPVPITEVPSGGKRVLFSVWDTRVQDYEAFAKETKREWLKVDFEQGPTHPAVNTSWVDAMAFCVWLSKKEGRTYRLPMDAEWSAAVGLGSESGETPADKNRKGGSVYPWGTQWPPPAGAGNYAGEEVKPPFPNTDWKVIAPGYNDGFQRTSPVGSFAPNQFGLYDMGGNVWQLCAERLTPSANSRYVLRGASWLFDGGEPIMRSDSRAGAGSGARCLHIGFRCVLETSPRTETVTSSPPVSVVPTTSTSPSTSTGAIQTFAGHRYQFVSGTMTWANAKLKAEEMGGHLATITSQEESDFIYRLCQGHLQLRVQMAWLGAWRTAEGNNWSWVTGERWGYSNWISPQSSTTKGDQLALINYAREWNDFEVSAASKVTQYLVGLVVEWDAELPVTSKMPTTKTADLPAAFTNSLGMKFAPVPGTKVLFCIHETRRQDYIAYARAVSGVDDSWKNQTYNNTPCGHEDTHPVVGVSWEDARAFCSWLNKKEARTYRLPTDEEWSIAVGLGQKEQRGPSTTPQMLNDKEWTEFPWGGGYPPKTADQAGNYADTAFSAKFPITNFFSGYTDGFVTTSPVMSCKPNPLGLYDLGGNVWEWCEDLYDNTRTTRVLRGGSWYDLDFRSYLLSSHRKSYLPGNRDDNCGFRCVVEK